MQTLSPPDTSLPVPPPLPTEISIAFDILLSDFPEHVRGRGLSLEMLVEWNQVRSVLEAGTVAERIRSAILTRRGHLGSILSRRLTFSTN